MIRGLAVLAFLVAGGAAPTPTSEPISRTSRVAGYEMTFSLPRSVWSTSESIVGEATLTKLEGPETVVSVVGSNLLRFRLEAAGFDYPEASTLQCSRHSITPGVPVSSEIRKPGGGFDPDDPQDQAYMNWFQQDGIFLTPGEWRITAIASFHDDLECEGQRHVLSIPVTVTVVG